MAVEDPGGALQGLEAAVGGVLEVVGHPGDLVRCVVVCGMLGWELWGCALLSVNERLGEKETQGRFGSVAKP